MRRALGMALSDFVNIGELPLLNER